MSRTPDELIQAAKDNGFEGDPLTSEILTELKRLVAENEDFTKTKLGTNNNRVGESSEAKRTSLWLVAVPLTAAVVLAAVTFVMVGQNRKLAEEAQHYQQTVSELRAANDTFQHQAVELSGRLQAALDAAANITKANASAADANNAAVKAYVAQLQTLIEDAAKQKASAAQLEQPTKQLVK